MSLRIETTPNQYTDYDLYSATRLNQLGQQFLSLVNPKYGTTDKKENPSKENEPPAEEIKTLPPNHIEKASDLCRPLSEQYPYYLANQEVIQQIEEGLLPNQLIFPYTPPEIPGNGTDEQLTASISDWQTLKQSEESNQYILSQIITIVQCRSTLSSSPFASPSAAHRIHRHAVRLFINSHQQQQQQMNTFLDIVNEALLLEPDTIKTLWDAKGEQVKRIN